jgi:hypothetical protein
VSGDNRTIKLDGPLTLELPDGTLMRVRPGPYGKGVAFIPVTSAQHGAGSDAQGKRGRRPRPGTVALREQLMRDAKAKRLRSSGHYVKWILARDDGLSLAVARQIVYRERRMVEASIPS